MSPGPCRAQPRGILAYAVVVSISTENGPAPHWPNTTGFADLSGNAKAQQVPIGWFGRPLFIPSGVLSESMFVPGIISLAFYKRKPSRVQIILGLVATVVLSALLGYISPPVPFGQLGSVILAVIGGVILYVAILAILLYWYQPRHAKPKPPKPTSPAPAP